MKTQNQKEETVAREKLPLFFNKSYLNYVSHDDFGRLSSAAQIENRTRQND